MHGGNVNWVIAQFPIELEVCRRRHRARANTLLIVVVDADSFSVAERNGHLNKVAQPASDDPAVILIPKRHIETWIRAALGDNVNQDDSYKKPEPKKLEIRTAATQIHNWARDNPKPGPACVDSLRQSISEWRKIG